MSTDQPTSTDLTSSAVTSTASTSTARTDVHGGVDATGMTVAIVGSRFNSFVVDPLVAGARDTFVRHGASPDRVHVVHVPGAWEIPVVARQLAESGRYDAIVGVGAVIRGSTYHFEVVANQSAAGLAHVAASTGVVVTNAILTVETTDQAIERAGGKAGNKGAEAAMAAIETVDVLRRILSDTG